jgi:hypothetical protein
MLSEAGEVHGAFERVSWVAGVLTTTGRLLVSHALRPAGPRRPIAATCAALYFGLFSSFVAARLSLELATGHVPLLFGSPRVSVIRCLGLCLVSFAVTLAIWLRRRIGRPMAIAFAGIQLVTLVAVHDLTQPLSTAFRLAAAALVIVLMCSRGVRAMSAPLQ